MTEQPTVEERRAALERRHPSWPSRTLADALEAAAAEYPDRPFVLTDELTITYREMADWSARLTRGLLARGVRPGENLALVLSNRPELVALLFAVARAGAVAVPISFQLRARELSYVLRQSRSVGLVTLEGFRDLDHLAELGAVAPGWEHSAGGDALPSLRFVVT